MLVGQRFDSVVPIALDWEVVVRRVGFQPIHGNVVLKGGIVGLLARPVVVQVDLVRQREFLLGDEPIEVVRRGPDQDPPQRGRPTREGPFSCEGNGHAPSRVHPHGQVQVSDVAMTVPWGDRDLGGHVPWLPDDHGRREEKEEEIREIHGSRGQAVCATKSSLPIDR